MNARELFLKHLAQTSSSPMAIEVASAEGCVLTDVTGRKYLDLIGGISVASVGHRNPEVVKAIREQAEKYLHVMVYGEFILSPQVEFAEALTRNLPPSLDSVYFTSSGTEATEGAMKLAKRVTKRTQFIAFRNSYHGSTQGALSVMGDEYWRNSFRPLLPGITHLDYNDTKSLLAITEEVGAVILETVQAESGIHSPDTSWMAALRRKCDETGSLLILDEIQAGLGRTGRLWAFENFGIVPDILLTGKALGGGMPLGAFIAGRELMHQLMEEPVLGHITTFGGHPVCCAAGKAAYEFLQINDLISQVKNKEKIFLELIPSTRFKIRSAGLWLAVDMQTQSNNKKLIDHCLANGLLTDWFLFAPHCMRISPPLTISIAEIEKACGIISQGIKKI